MTSLLNAMLAEDVNALADRVETVDGLHDRKKFVQIVHGALWLCASRPDSTAYAYAWMALMGALGIKTWGFKEPDPTPAHAMTPLNGPALEKARQQYMHDWLETGKSPAQCFEDAIRNYIDALPQSGAAARLNLVAFIREGDDPNDNVAALLREAATAISGVELPGWRTIESAPKDGTEILVVWPQQGGVMDLISWSIHGYWQSKGKPKLNMQATHWRPRPSPPPVTGDAP